MKTNKVVYLLPNQSGYAWAITQLKERGDIVYYDTRLPAQKINTQLFLVDPKEVHGDWTCEGFTLNPYLLSRIYHSLNNLEENEPNRT